MQIFGFDITRKKTASVPSIVAPGTDDGSIVTVGNAAAYYSQVMDLEGVVKNENDLIRRYREISQYPDCDSAIEDIINEAIVTDEADQSVDIVLDDLKLSESIKKKFREEFDNVLRLLKFEEKGHDLFRSWYIDGRLYYHILIDENKVKDGIVELRYIDPRKIKKVKTIHKQKDPNGIEVVKNIEEYYIYNDKGITESTTQGVKLSKDSVLYCPSGLHDANTGMMLGHLHKAIKSVNQLKMIEDAVVIYRISRAPERRIFYVDVGNLPKLKAEQYVNDLMNRYRNKITYDATTGEVRDDRKHLSMMEDFWMPRREGGRGTEITTLPGGQNLGEIQDIEYFQKKLYQSLNVPMSRMNPDQTFGLGRATEISRDEVKFSKFIARIRRKFSMLFTDTLRVQLISKGVVRADEWDDLKTFIRYDFKRDNYYTELKENEILKQRIDMLQQVEPYLGKFYSVEWVRQNVLRQSGEMIEEIDAQIEDEEKQHFDNAERDGTLAAHKQIAQQSALSNAGYGDDAGSDTGQGEEK